MSISKVGDGSLLIETVAGALEVSALLIALS